MSSFEAVILAAGFSSRFNFKNSQFKKFLLPFKKSIIINYVIGAIIKSGIEKITLVVDENIKQENIIKKNKNFLEKLALNRVNFNLNFVTNDKIERENGYSLYLGVKNVESKNFILSMADHVFSKNVYSILKNRYNKEDILLATDPMEIKGIYDLEDCTKVYGKDNQIKSIGKKISSYNRLDMGVFIMKTSAIQSISEKINEKKDEYGVSDVLISAIDSQKKVCYEDFPNTLWLDIDNYYEYKKLKKNFSKTSKFKPFNLKI